MITLTQMATLSTALLNADAAVEEAEKALDIAKERARLLREETIPSAMQELGLKKLVLETGAQISVAQEVYASVPAHSKGAAYAWLDEHGFGGLIKTSVVVSYAKGQKEEALALNEELFERGLQSELSESVHAQTLKAFLKEQIAAGTDIPLDLFGARPVWTAKIKK